MKIEMKPSAVKEASWKEYATRFAFGGLITGVTGLIAHKFGPIVGGLFLGFPAILPASLTLVAKHEDEREEKHGEKSAGRGLQAAGVDAAGAAIGSFGLLAFGSVVWALAAQHPAWETLGLATLAWTAVSLIGWVIRQKM